MDEVGIPNGGRSISKEKGIFDELIEAFGLPEDLVKPWLENKLNFYGINKDQMTLEQARELTAELVLEFFLNAELQSDIG